MNCCGASGPDDYKHSAWFNRSRPVEEVFVPPSCCVSALDPPSSAPAADDARRREAPLPLPLPPRPSQSRDLQSSCQLNAILFPHSNDKSSRSLRTQVCQLSVNERQQTELTIRHHRVGYLIFYNLKKPEPLFIIGAQYHDNPSF